MQVYLAKNGQQTGPYTVEQINAEVTAGRIKATDLAWMQGWSAWQPVSMVPGLLSASSPHPPPADAPPPPPPPPAPILPPSPIASDTVRLWNPNAVGWWSFVLTPIFGSLLLAANWRALGDRKRGRKSLMWIAFIMAVFIVATVVPAVGNMVSGFGVAVPVALWVAWSVSEARPQTQYVKSIFPTGYQKRPLWLPVIVGLIIVGIWTMLIIHAQQHGGSGAGSVEQRAPASPKERTVATWKAYQKIDHDNLGAISGGQMGDLAMTEATIKAFRNMAFGYSQLDLAEVNQILIDHLHHRMKTTSRAADVLESRYADIVDAMKARDSSIRLSRQVGGVLAGDENRQGGGDFAEWLYRLGTDEDFQKQLEQINERHQPEIQAMSQELSQLEEEEKAAASELTRKYGVEFIIPSS